MVIENNFDTDEKNNFISGQTGPISFNIFCKVHVPHTHALCLYRTEQNLSVIKLRPHTGGVRTQRWIQTVIYRHAELSNIRNNTRNVMNTYIILKTLVESVM